MRLFNPTISGLVAATEEDWGDTKQNVEDAIRYRIKPIDDALFGINMRDGEMIGVHAVKKMRKSTLVLNLVLGFAHQLKGRSEGYWVCADTLESGMPPQAYRDSLIAMAATRLLVSRFYGNDRDKWPSVETIKAHPELGPMMNISREFFLYGRRTPEQQEAIELAKRAVASMPISIFGAASFQGKTRNVDATVKRWSELYHGKYIHRHKIGGEIKEVDMTGLHHRIFSTDHISQLSGFGASSFEMQETVVSKYAEFCTEHPGSVVIAVGQIGSSSAKDEKRGFGDANTKGGTALAAEVTVLFRTEYDKDKSPFKMKIWVQDTRKRPPPPIIQDIDDQSGAFLGTRVARNGEEGGVRIDRRY